MRGRGGRGRSASGVGPHDAGSRGKRGRPGEEGGRGGGEEDGVADVVSREELRKRRPIYMDAFTSFRREMGMDDEAAGANAAGEPIQGKDLARQKEKHEAEVKRLAQGTKQEAKEDKSVLVARIPETATPEELQAFLSVKAGRVRTVTFKYKRKKKGEKKFTGTAVVEMAKLQSAYKAVELDGHSFQGALLKIKRMDPTSTKLKKLHNALVDEEASIFVGNLAFGTSEITLQKVFSRYGDVIRVSLPRNKVTKHPRGFAVVEFAGAASAKHAAMKHNGKTIDGSPVVVKVYTDPHDEPGEQVTHQVRRLDNIASEPLATGSSVKEAAPSETSDVSDRVLELFTGPTRGRGRGMDMGSGRGRGTGRGRGRGRGMGMGMGMGIRGGFATAAGRGRGRGRGRGTGTGTRGRGRGTRGRGRRGSSSADGPSPPSTKRRMV
ncbi:hypothetical protein Pelo_11902 [Pelomyxa schiedti]|nr:hypothetical protein Pelo_11902 [Pelomyxa schiedti]